MCGVAGAGWGRIIARLRCVREEAANGLSTLNDKLHISTNQEVQKFSRKILSFILIKRSRTQKKDVCSDRNTSGLDSSQFRMVA